jgi:hypothetical protein
MDLYCLYWPYNVSSVLAKCHIFYLFCGRLHLLSLKGYFYLTLKFLMLSLSRELNHLIFFGFMSCLWILSLQFCCFLYVNGGSIYFKVPGCWSLGSSYCLLSLFFFYCRRWYFELRLIVRLIKKIIYFVMIYFIIK